MIIRMLTETSLAASVVSFSTANFAESSVKVKSAEAGKSGGAGETGGKAGGTGETGGKAGGAGEPCSLSRQEKRTTAGGVLS